MVAVKTCAACEGTRQVWIAPFRWRPCSVCDPDGFTRWWRTKTPGEALGVCDPPLPAYQDPVTPGKPS